MLALVERVHRQKMEERYIRYKQHDEVTKLQEDKSYLKGPQEGMWLDRTKYSWGGMRDENKEVWWGEARW